MAFLSSGLVGLVLSYALSLTGLLSGLVSSFTQTEGMMVSVERLEEYSCGVPQEPRGQPRQVSRPLPQARGAGPGSSCLPRSFPLAPAVFTSPASWFDCRHSSLHPRPHVHPPVCSLFSPPLLPPSHLAPSPSASLPICPCHRSSFPSSPQTPYQGIRWLTRGSVEFQDVVLVYRPGLPNALDRVTFRVEPGEKLGIVGRTGSGKSSLFSVLFRLLEPTAGRVLLDGVDTSQLELAELRSGARWFGEGGEGSGSHSGKVKGNSGQPIRSQGR